MAIDIRPISDEELERAHFLLAYSFTSDRSPEARLQHLESFGPAFAAYEDSEMVACLRIFPLRMFIHGASIPLGGVSGVASLPEHRRKGYVGQLLRHAVQVMREAGQPLSALYTPHPSLYRRYGWMFAASDLRYSFDPKQVALVNQARPQGRAYRVSEEEWPAIAELYRRFAAPRNGYLDRDERWWKEGIFRRIYDEKRQPNDVAVWADGDGQPRGYVVYRSGRERGPDGIPSGRLDVEELVALDSSAYLGLLRYVLAHDLANTVAMWAAVDDPLPLALDEPWRLKREHFFGFMLRIVDVEGAVAARPPAADAPEGAFTVHIADAAVPWNQGVWRIESAGGRLSAARADGTADLSTAAAAFAAMYNGFLRPTEAVRTGLADASDSEATALADRILAADYPPHPGDFF